MKRISILSLLILSLVSCNKAAENKQVKQEIKQIQLPKASIVLESFNDFPEEIDGAGCTFAANKKNYLKEKYIYADNLDSLCFVKIKGRFIRFELIEDKSPKSSVDYYSKKFKNDEYQLSIDLKKVEEYDEATFLKGYMLLKPNDGPEEKIELYGLCGC